MGCRLACQLQQHLLLVIRWQRGKNNLARHQVAKFHGGGVLFRSRRCTASPLSAEAKWPPGPTRISESAAACLSPISLAVARSRIDPPYIAVFYSPIDDVGRTAAGIPEDQELAVRQVELHDGLADRQLRHLNSVSATTADWHGARLRRHRHPAQPYSRDRRIRRTTCRGFTPWW